jgi:hypothetical protein
MLQVSDFLRGYDFPVGQTLGSFEMSQLLLSFKRVAKSTKDFLLPFHNYRIFKTGG